MPKIPREYTEKVIDEVLEVVKREFATKEDLQTQQKTDYVDYKSLVVPIVKSEIENGYRFDNILTDELENNLVEKVRELIPVPKDGKKGNDGKDYVLTDQDRTDIAESVTLKGVIKEEVFNQRMAQFVDDVQKGNIPLPARGGANGPEIIKKINKLTTWDDLSAAIIAARLDTASGRLQYDYFNGGVTFNSNARYPEEPVVIPVQFKHHQAYGTGAVLRPHFHWYQQQTAIPNFLLLYKKVNWGETTTLETDFSNYTALTPSVNAFEYDSGTLGQITGFPEIDASDVVLSGTGLTL
jgi:hypothetical protein